MNATVLGALVRAAASPLALGAGAPPANDEGVSLDADFHALAVAHRRLGLPGLGSASPAAARRVLDLIGRTMGPRQPPPMARVEDRTLALTPRDVPVRVYTPAEACAGLMVYLHGGGFTIGGLASYDGVCRLLAGIAGCVVVSVDYALAPEHPFPAAVQDTQGAFQWAADHRETLAGPGAPLVLCGDSAGGTLTAVICQQQLAAGRALPDLQVPIYPATDLTCSAPSHDLFASGFPLDRAAMDFFLGCYLPPGQDRRDPRVSPLFAEDLRGLPPTILVTAGHDMLRDEGRQYAARLQTAGVELIHIEHASLPHGFVNAPGVVPAGQRAMEALAELIGKATANIKCQVVGSDPPT